MMWCLRYLILLLACGFLTGCGPEAKDKEISALKADMNNQAAASAKEIADLKSQIKQLTENNEELKKIMLAAAKPALNSTQTVLHSGPRIIGSADPESNPLRQEVFLAAIYAARKKHASATNLLEYMYWKETAQTIADEIAPKLPSGELSFEGVLTCANADTPGSYILRPVMQFAGSSEATNTTRDMQLKFMEFQSSLPNELIASMSNREPVRISFPVQWAIGYVNNKTEIKKFFQKPSTNAPAMPVNCIARCTAMDFGNAASSGAAVRYYLCAAPSTVKVMIRNTHVVSYQPLNGGGKDVLITARERNFYPAD